MKNHHKFKPKIFTVKFMNKSIQQQIHKKKSSRSNVKKQRRKNGGAARSAKMKQKEAEIKN